MTVCVRLFRANPLSFDYALLFTLHQSYKRVVELDTRKMKIFWPAAFLLMLSETMFVSAESPSRYEVVVHVAVHEESTVYCELDVVRLIVSTPADGIDDVVGNTTWTAAEVSCPSDEALPYLLRLHHRQGAKGTECIAPHTYEDADGMRTMIEAAPAFLEREVASLLHATQNRGGIKLHFVIPRIPTKSEFGCGANTVIGLELTSHLRLVRRGVQRDTSTAKTSRRRRFATSATVDPDLRILHLTPIQASGPVETQLSITFVSSGFLEEQYADFVRNVSNIVSVLHDPRQPSLEKTFPLLRFSRHINIFGIFIASPSEGVTILGRGVVETALRCTYYPLIQEWDGRLQCDPTISAAVADASEAEPFRYPDTTLTIAIVNTRQRGAIGVNSPYKVVTISNAYDIDLSEDRTALLAGLAHTIGHALFGLSDEYDIAGANEASPVPFPNCVHPSSPVPWSDWIFEQRSNASFSSIPLGGSNAPLDVSLDQTPATPCGFSNYRRPSSHCLMSRWAINGSEQVEYSQNLLKKLEDEARLFANRDKNGTLEAKLAGLQSVVAPTATALPLSRQHYCPVCRQHSMLWLLDTLRTNPARKVTAAKLEDTPWLLWPRCPLETEIIICAISDVVWVHTNRYTTKSNGFSTVWRLGEEIIAQDETSIQVSVVKMVGLGRSSNFNISLTVTDTTTESWLLPSERTLDRRQYTTRFFFQVVSDPSEFAGWSAAECQNPMFGHRGGTYRSFCSAVGACSYSYTTSDTINAPEVVRRAPGYSLISFVVAILILVPWIQLAVQEWLKAQRTYIDMGDLHRRLEMKTLHRFIRYGTGAFGVLCAIAAASGFLTGIKLYVVLGTLTQSALLGVCVVAVITNAIAYLSFRGAYLKAPEPVLVSTVILSMATITIFVLLLSLGRLESYLVDPDGDWLASMETTWKDSVRDSPTGVCELQQQLRCSGWSKSCQQLNSTVTCPSNCVVNNAFGAACRDVMEQELKNQLEFAFHLIRALSPIMLCVTFLHIAAFRVFKRLTVQAERIKEGKPPKRKKPKKEKTKKRDAEAGGDALRSQSDDSLEEELLQYPFHDRNNDVDDESEWRSNSTPSTRAAEAINGPALVNILSPEKRKEYDEREAAAEAARREAENKQRRLNALLDLTLSPGSPTRKRDATDVPDVKKEKAPPIVSFADLQRTQSQKSV